MAPHPLCNRIPVQTGSKFVAIVNLSVGILFLLSGIIMITLQDQPFVWDKETTERLASNPKCLWPNTITDGAMRIIFSLLLLQGARTKSLWKLRAFPTVVLIDGFNCITFITRNASFPVPDISWIVFAMCTVRVAWTVFAVYSVWIVHSFIGEVKLDQLGEYLDARKASSNK